MSAQADLFGSGKVHSYAHDTESESAKPDRSRLRQRVLDVFRNAGPGGLTDEQAAARAGILRSHSAATRRAELMERGYPIRKTTRRGRTASGKTAIIWAFIVEDERP